MLCMVLVNLGCIITGLWWNAHPTKVFITFMSLVTLRISMAGVSFLCVIIMLMSSGMVRSII